MKKFIYSLFVIGIFALYAADQGRSVTADNGAVISAPISLSSPVAAPNQPTTALATPIQPVVNNPAPKTPAPPPAPAPAAVIKPKGQYTDGQYTGSVADAYYGNIQVRVTISGGKVSDVVFLQYPNDRGNSIAINRQAMPYLRQEAISAQSANVDIVSGATDSSIAFQQSLASALAEAKS